MHHNTKLNEAIRNNNARLFICLSEIKFLKECYTKKNAIKFLDIVDRFCRNKVFVN